MKNFLLLFILLTGSCSIENELPVKDYTFEMTYDNEFMYVDLNFETKRIWKIEFLKNGNIYSSVSGNDTGCGSIKHSRKVGITCARLLFYEVEETKCIEQ